MNHDPLIRTFILTEFLPGADPQELRDDDDLLASGVLDSLGVLKLIAWVEQRFDLVVADDDLDPDNFRSVHAVSHFIRAAVPVG